MYITRSSIMDHESVTGSGGQMKYGHQRVWGTIGFGITALLAGGAIDWWSAGSSTKDYTPAFLIVLIFSTVDILCCLRLRVSFKFGMYYDLHM